jgi:DNA-binding HxlR family transcriptional regulator
MPAFHLRGLAHPRALRVGRALLARPARFIDLQKVVAHSEALSRVINKLVSDQLIEKMNSGEYRLTARGISWAHAGAPLLAWLDENRSAIEETRTPNFLAAERLSTIVDTTPR